MRLRKILTGKKFGKLLVLGLTGNLSQKAYKWLCLCDCGNTTEIVGSNLTRGNTKSCGCYRFEVNFVHGKTGTKGYARAKSAGRLADKLKRTPKWLTDKDWEKISLFYANCPKGYHVDHDAPLRGTLVSGLHVLENLQYLPMKENLQKSNKFEPQFITK